MSDPRQTFDTVVPHRLDGKHVLSSLVLVSGQDGVPESIPMSSHRPLRHPHSLETHQAQKVSSTLIRSGRARGEVIR